jgi:hypothetical protein
MQNGDIFFASRLCLSSLSKHEQTHTFPKEHADIRRASAGSSRKPPPGLVAALMLGILRGRTLLDTRAHAPCYAGARSLIRGLLRRCVLYFRREDPASGQLDFVPAAVYPERQRVWVVGEGRGGLPAPGPGELPGFISAASLLPDYPFVRTRSSPHGAALLWPCEPARPVGGEHSAPLPLPPAGSVGIDSSAA